MSYIRGKNALAATGLMDELRRVGVVATVGYMTPNKRLELLVQVRTGDPKLVPAEWGGFSTVIDQTLTTGGAP